MLSLGGGEAQRRGGSSGIGPVNLHVHVGRSRGHAEQQATGTAREAPRHAATVEACGHRPDHGKDARGGWGPRRYAASPVPGRFFITTPIYYVNADPHVGHAYTTIMADVFARHHRQRGEDVFFLTGTDEHGAKIARSAEDTGRTPREHADELSRRFREMAGVLGASNDFFIRTTDTPHMSVVQQLIQRMHDTGDIYKGSYGGWYCTSCEAFYTEGDLAEGQTCPAHQRPVEWIEEDNWFFRLSAYRDRLLAHYDATPDFVRPSSRMNEARRMVEDGLDDLSISRAHVEWGVAVPWDPSNTVYVWVDALFNYYTALTYAGDGGADLVERFWPPTLQLMAKDILRFHAVIWPALLMSADLTLPERLVVHGYILKGGERLSKTTGNVVDPFPYIERYGLDALRYYLCREIQFGEDGTFTDEGFHTRYTSELANDFGNLLSRTATMIARFSGGVVPLNPGGDLELAAECDVARTAVVDAFSREDVTGAVEAAWTWVRRLNRLVEEREPWVLAKDHARAPELDQALFSLASGLRVAAILLWPVLPTSCETVLVALGEPTDRVALFDAAWGGGAPGARVVIGPPLFPRIEVVEVAT
ncbi:MAG: methionine--tRNA ligase [Thermoleophilia bacterium]|nr:methionine--tRNA ligase [Thermoleophilia bacterium]